MAYQYNAVGSAPKILGQTFIVDKLEQLADNLYANKWGSILVYTTTYGDAYYTIIPCGETSSSNSFGTLTQSYSNGSTEANKVLETCVVEGHTYYGSKSALYALASSARKVKGGQTLYALVYRAATQNIELLSYTYTTDTGVSTGNYNLCVFVPKVFDDIVLALWCEPTA